MMAYYAAISAIPTFMIQSMSQQLSLRPPGAISRSIHDDRNLSSDS
jgi:hypothetical protein